MGSPVDDALDRHRSEADYIDRTIATVRNHRGADNCWPQWANIFADEIEDLRGDVRRLREERDAYRIEGDHGHDDYEDAEDVIRQIAEARVNQPFDPWARGLCQEFLDRPSRSRTTIATISERAEAAEAELERLRRHPDAWSQEAFDQQKARAEAAEAEVQRLTEKNEKLSALIMEQEAEYRKEKRAAEAEVQRLREGLRELLGPNPTYDPDGQHDYGWENDPPKRFAPRWVRDKASDLLTGSEAEPVYCVCGNILGSENCCPEPDQGGEAGGWGVQSSGGGVPPDGGGAK